MPKHEPTWPALVCTRCGGSLWIYLDDDVVDCVECETCYAGWDKFGNPIAVDWLKEMPEENPDA